MITANTDFELRKKFVEETDIEFSISKTIEELAELIVSLSYLLSKRKDGFEKIIEETADVLNMVEMLYVIFNDENFKEKVEKIKEEKFERFKNRIEMGFYDANKV